VHKINCKAGRAARRESGSLDPRLLRHQTNHELATFAPLIPTSVQSVRQILHYLSSSKSITFLSRTYLKPRFLAVQCGFVGKSTITPPHPSYQYSIREAERIYKARLHITWNLDRSSCQSSLAAIKSEYRGHIGNWKVALPRIFVDTLSEHYHGFSTRRGDRYLLSESYNQSYAWEVHDRCLG
jgi:hypothetical protein